MSEITEAKKTRARRTLAERLADQQERNKKLLAEKREQRAKLHEEIALLEKAIGAGA